VGGLSLGELFEENKEKNKIFKTLTQTLSRESLETKAKIVHILRCYLSSKFPDTVIEISLNSLIVRISNCTRDTDIYQLLGSIAQDERIVGLNVHEFFERALIDFFEMSTTDTAEVLNRYRDDILTPASLQDSSKCYLLLKIHRSANRVKGEEDKYRLEAWFLNSTDTPPREENYIPFNDIVQHDIDYSKEEIKSVLGQIISKCRSYVETTNINLVVEFFTVPDLLSTDFECWEYEEYPEAKQLRRGGYVVHVRSVYRLLPVYQDTDGERFWKNKWQNINRQGFPVHEPLSSLETLNEDELDEHFCPESKLWANICIRDSDRLHTVFRKILKYGIPVAIWSRLHNQAQRHRAEIDRLIKNGDSLDTLSYRIQNKRTTPDPLDDGLRHNISLLWEDPDRLPPFRHLTS
jgi:hypothetical protein